MTATASATMAYDSNGNLSGKSDATNSWIYSWDYENRMTAASTAAGTVRYVYDGLGRRVERSMDGTLDDMKFVYDGLDVVMDDDFYTGVTKYQNGPGIDDKLSLKNGGVTKYFLHDHLGSTVALTDSSGAVTETTSYDSFGNHSTNLSTRYQYTGREYDSFSGLYYYRARWYDANLGRFISEDPIGFEAGDIDLFAYVANDPMNKTDPSGETEESMIDRLQHYSDPATRPFVSNWNSCQADCIADYGAAQVPAFVGFVFGQPVTPKRFVSPGSSSATSPISATLSKWFPQRLSRRVWAPTFQRPFATTNVLGRAAGRWIPIISVVVMAADFEAIRACTNECYKNRCGR